ncbi:MAG TPA: PAS domain-containing protein [Burkholderiaceae bacterium]|nr:PAS domain-containing protein [Burkholderiaceae bacterium]
MSQDSRDAALQRALAEVARLQADNRRLTEMLDLAQEFGRLGVWERDPNTLEGRWDRHVFRFFGFPADVTRTPPFAEAAERVHPEDRLDDTFRDSLQQPGVHEHRYRIVQPDGSVRHMHSQWRVIGGADGKAERVIGVLLDDTEVHELAAQAHAAAAQLEMALAVSDIGLWRYDFATRRIHHDARVQAQLGRPMGPEGVPIETVRSWIHPDDVEDVRRSFEQAVASGRPVDTQTRYLHADGTWRTSLTRRVVQRDASGQPVMMIGVGMDVTEQQARNAEALQLAKRLDAAAEAARVGLWSGPLDDRPAEWNSRMFALLGHDPAGGALRLGDSLRRYVHPADRDRLVALVLAWMRGPVDLPFAAETRIVRGDGALRWMEIRGAQEVGADGVRRAFGVMLDVTEQREVLERLREEHERVTLAMSAVGMGTWLYDPLSGHDEWDEQMFHLRGLAPGPQVPSHEERMALVVPEDRVAMQLAFERTLASAAPTSHEFTIRRPDGQLRTLASRSVALTDADGRVTRRLGVNWDVTEARQLERAQRERELALRESRTKSALFARVSHELRTPLNAVLGFTQLLLAEGERADPMQRRRRLEQIRVAGQSLLTLIDGVLDLSEQAGSPSAPRREPVRLADAVAHALEPLADAIAARQLEVVRGDLSLSVRADPRRVQQVIAQLVGNAVKFNRPGGTVRIEARIDQPDAVLGVADSGPGIAPARAARLFEPFDGEAARGHGLGLAIAQALVQRMGGTIALARNGSEGCLFELRLPLADAPPVAAPPAVGPALLYVEDNEVNMMIVRELLAQRPHIAFHGAPDGESGLRSARALQPALVLVDMQLPDFDGLEVLRRLRADPATATIRCVALSANAMHEDMQRARAAGFDDYWTKPIDLANFLGAIDRLLPSPGR